MVQREMEAIDAEGVKFAHTFDDGVGTPDEALANPSLVSRKLSLSSEAHIPRAPEVFSIRRATIAGPIASTIAASSASASASVLRHSGIA